MFKSCFQLSFVICFVTAATVSAQVAKPSAGKSAEVNAAFDKSKTTVVSRLELNESTVAEAARLVSEIAQVNIVATEEAGLKTVSLFLRDVKAIDAVETVCKVAGLWYREEADVGLIRIMTTEEYGKDLVIYRDDVTKVFTVLHPNVFSIAQHIQDLYGERVVLSLPRFYDDQFLAQAGMQSQMLSQTMQMMGMGSGGGGGFGGGGFGGGGSFGGYGIGSGGRGMMGMGGMGMMGMGGMGMGGMGMGGMGMGGMGMMGMGGFGGGGSQGQRGFTADATSRRDEILAADQQLTAAQLEAIRRRAQDGQKADGAGADAIQEVTSQEPPIYVVINQTHGLIIVRTSDQEAMDSIAVLIEELDRPTPQVLLEVKILEITLGDQFKSAFDFEFNDNGTPVTDDDGNTVNGSLVNTATQEFLGAAGSVLTNGHAAGMGNFGLDPDGSTFVYQFLNDKFRARIQLLNDENRVNVIATPMLLASNNRPASLRIGEERRLTDGVTTDTVASQAGTTTGTTIETSQQQIGTSLMLLPKINADRTVTLTVFQERTGDDTGKTDIIPISSTEVVARPVISNATTVNTIVARDGLTMAIGGLIEERVVRRQIKVPLLGDLPVLGTLFRKEFSQDRKTELVVLLTPHVISTPEATGRVTQGRLKALSSHNYVRNGFEDREGHHGVNNLPPNYGEGMPNSFYQILPGRFQLK